MRLVNEKNNLKTDDVCFGYFQQRLIVGRTERKNPIFFFPILFSVNICKERKNDVDDKSERIQYSADIVRKYNLIFI